MLAHEFEAFWRWCITLRIAVFLDFVHRPEFWMLENWTFRKLDLFPSSGEGWETPTMLGSLGRANLQWLKLGMQAQVVTSLTFTEPQITI
jgi:hypothetical protein